MYYVGSMAYDPNYLEHFGILGMKWGVRRYQNPDGSLTAAGKAKYVQNPDGSIRKKQWPEMSSKEKVAKVAKTVAKGAAIAAAGYFAGTAALGALRLADISMNKGYFKAGKDFVETTLQETTLQETILQETILQERHP